MCNKLFIKTVLAVAICAAGTNAQAQDLHFSQFYENATLRNPALVGIFSGDYKAGVSYRQQWGNISVPFQTVLAAGELKIPVNQVGDYFSTGLSVLYDKAGSTSLTNLQIYPAINYNKHLEDEHHSYLSVGMAGGFIQRSVDASKMIFGDQFANGAYSPDNTSAEMLNTSTAHYFDVGAGVSFNSSMTSDNHINYYLGGAAYHLNKPRISFHNDETIQRLQTKYNGAAGLQWAIDGHTMLTFHGNYSRQGENQETIAGVLGSWRMPDPVTKKKFFALYAGVFYRVNDAWIPTVKVDYKTYAFTVSYDINSSKLTKATNGMGGFEISIFTKGILTTGRWAADRTECPRFEEMPAPEY